MSDEQRADVRLLPLFAGKGGGIRGSYFGSQPMSAQIKRFITTCDCMSQANWGAYVLHTDLLAAMAYDEEKERALFEGEFPYVSHSGSYDSWVSRWKYTHDAVDSLWFGWLACTKARAKAVWG